MDNSLTVNADLPLVEPASFAGRMAALPMRSKLSFGLGIAALAGVVLAMTLWSSKGDFKVLYANLSDKDGGAVIAQLSQMNVPYKMAEGGAAILVPAAQVHDLRLKLAVYNVLNQQRVVTVDQDYEPQDSIGTPNTMYGYGTGFQSPRYAQLTVTWNY